MSEERAENLRSRLRKAHYLRPLGRMATAERPNWTFNPSFEQFGTFPGALRRVGSDLGGLEDRSLEDVALRHLHRVQVEGGNRLRQDQAARDDRGRPVGVKAG